MEGLVTGEGPVTGRPLFKFTWFDWQINHPMELGAIGRPRCPPESLATDGVLLNFHGSISKLIIQGNCEAIEGSCCPPKSPVSPDNQRAQ